MSSNEYTVKLSTSDGQTKEVSWNVFRQFGLFAPQDDPESRPREAVPLPNVSSGALDKVIEYCEYHQNDSQENESTSSGNPRREPSKLSEWDQQFMQVEQEMIFELILAANYLDIKPLLDISCKTVANMIKNKTPEEIRKLFNIVNEFTPEEQAQIKEENGGCMQVRERAPGATALMHVATLRLHVIQSLIDVSSGGNWVGQKIPLVPGYQVPFAERVKTELPSLLVAAVGLITEPKQAEQLLQDEKADVLFFARELMRHADFPIYVAQELGIVIKPANQYEMAWARMVKPKN